VKTRTLILLALACGLAILLAGGIQLLRISGSKDKASTVLALGQAADVGGVGAVVDAAQTVGDQLQLTVRMTPGPGVTLADAESGWALLAGGKLRGPIAPSAGTAVMPCHGVAVASGQTTRCIVAFPAGGESPYASYAHGGHQRQWNV
jgi:hypothetical protein